MRKGALPSFLVLYTHPWKKRREPFGAHPPPGFCFSVRHIRRLGLQLHPDSPPTPPADTLCVPLIIQAYHVLGGAHIWTGQAPDQGDKAGFQGAPGGRGCGLQPRTRGLGGGDRKYHRLAPLLSQPGEGRPCGLLPLCKLCSVRHSPSLCKAPNYTAQVNCARSSNAGS